MLSLSKVMAWLLGPAAMPLMIITVLVIGGQMLEARRAALVKQGVQQCNADWENDILKVQRDAAIAEARAMRAQLNATDVLNMELKTNAAEIQREVDAVRAQLSGTEAALAAVASSDAGRCLSDSVRELARGVQGAGGGQERAKGSSQRRSSP